MEELLKEALSRYPLVKPQARLIRHNENATWQVVDEACAKTYVLRIHKPREGFSLKLMGGSREDALAGEMRLLEALSSRGDIPVQTPVKNFEGAVVTELSGGVRATLLTWLPGENLEKEEATPELLFEVGRMTALMHRCFQACPDLPKPPHAYDQALLNRMGERLRGFFSRGILDPRHSPAVFAALEAIGLRMAEMDRQGGAYGIVHADLSKGNMLLTQGRVAPIDFGLWGAGYFPMDLGGLACTYVQPQEQERLFAGYESVTRQRVDTRYVEPFVSLGVLLYVCSFGESAGGEEWFDPAMDRWCRTHFVPLAQGDGLSIA